MARHVCLKEWFNGNEISISIDDNLCDKFRGDVVIFHSDALEDKTDVGGCRCLSHMAELITKATNIALKNKGTGKPFESRILFDHESLEE